MLNSKLFTALTLSLSLFILLFTTGCGGSYLTPDRGANLAQVSDVDIAIIEQAEPVSPLPVNLLAVRVQSSYYRSYSNSSYGHGRYSVVTTRDIETDEHIQKIQDLPEVAQIISMSRLLLPERFESFKDLRRGAAKLHADMLLIYTVDTSFEKTDSATPLTVISLGLSPTQNVRVVTTVSALVVDVRTGYVYGACEATTRRKQIASAWTNEDAVDQSRLITEKAAFDDMLSEFAILWDGIVQSRQKALARN